MGAEGLTSSGPTFRPPQPFHFLQPLFPLLSTGVFQVAESRHFSRKTTKLQYHTFHCLVGRTAVPEPIEPYRGIHSGNHPSGFTFHQPVPKAAVFPVFEGEAGQE